MRSEADALLGQASELARAAVPPPRTEARGADLIGKDLRQAQLRGALFLTQSQMGSATGDPATLLPERLDRPPHFDD